MIRIENVQVMGWEPAIRGMRNPMNSWNKSDSYMCDEIHCRKCKAPWNKRNCNRPDEYVIGPNDLDLMQRLAAGGSVHAKYRRMIVVYLDVVAPLYWWKEADTYKVGTVANSCSTMHKIHAKEFTLDDFSVESVTQQSGEHPDQTVSESIVNLCENYRKEYLRTGDKRYWRALIQILPSSYNQRRTLMLNYEVLSHIYKDRKDHKLDEWREFCRWIETLPYAQLITGEVVTNGLFGNQEPEGTVAGEQGEG